MVKIIAAVLVVLAVFALAVNQRWISVAPSAHPTATQAAPAKELGN
jgi:hypothetical protein